MGAKRLFRDFADLVSGIDSHFDGQVRILDNSDDLRHIALKIKPNGSLYKGGTFVFTVTVPENYPAEVPTIKCQTKIYHPNIDTENDCDDDCTNICLNLLDEWTTNFGLVDLIQGVLFLFYEPTVDDALSPYFPPYDIDEFENNVRKSLRGETIDDWIDFEPNLDDDVITDTNESSDKTNDPSEDFNNDVNARNDVDVVNHTDVNTDMKIDNVESDTVHDVPNTADVITTDDVTNVDDRTTDTRLAVIKHGAPDRTNNVAAQFITIARMITDVMYAYSRFIQAIHDCRT